MSKLHDIIRKLSADGWGVTDCGHLVKPDLTLRDTPVKYAKGSRPDYLKFNVKHEGCSYPVLLHKLAAYQKYGEAAFEEGIVVRHLDNNSLNNELDNIAIGSQSDNMMDRPVEERKRHALHAWDGRRHFTDEQIKMIRSSSQSGKSLARDLGVAKTIIHDIRNLKTYRHVRS